MQNKENQSSSPSRELAAGASHDGRRKFAKRAAAAINAFALVALLVPCGSASLATETSRSDNPNDGSIAGRPPVDRRRPVEKAAQATETRTPESFSIVLLPDTQFYSQRFPNTYSAQTQWIKTSLAERNIKFVIQLGDLVETPDSETEWAVADQALKVLDGQVPYSVLPGNHDGAPGKLALYNKYFGPARFADQPWYGGSISPTNNAVNYCRFAAGGQQWMVLSLTYDPTDTELAWAGGVAAAHPDDNIILATHAYLIGSGKRGPRGRLIWDHLVRKTPNIRMVVCGHVPRVAHDLAVNDSGDQVLEILCDYQGQPNGGNGWLQIMRIDPAVGKIRVEAYSPLLDTYDKAPTQTYTMELSLPDL